MARSTPISRHVGRLSRSQVAAKRGLHKGASSVGRCAEESWMGGMERKMGMERDRTARGRGQGVRASGDGGGRWGRENGAATRGALVRGSISKCDGVERGLVYERLALPRLALPVASPHPLPRAVPLPPAYVSLVRSSHPTLSIPHSPPPSPLSLTGTTLTFRQEDRCPGQEDRDPGHHREDRWRQGQRREAHHPHRQGVQVLPRRGRSQAQGCAQARRQGRSPRLDHPRHRPHPPRRPLLGPPCCLP